MRNFLHFGFCLCVLIAVFSPQSAHCENLPSPPGFPTIVPLPNFHPDPCGGPHSVYKVCGEIDESVRGALSIDEIISLMTKSNRCPKDAVRKQLDFSSILYDITWTDFSYYCCCYAPQVYTDAHDEIW